MSPRQPNSWEQGAPLAPTGLCHQEAPPNGRRAAVGPSSGPPKLRKHDLTASRFARISSGPHANPCLSHSVL